MFETPFFARPIEEPALEREDRLWRVERECVRLARALVASSDPNDRWREARHRMRGRRYRQLDELVQNLKHGSVPFALRAMGPLAVDQQALRAHLETFLTEILWDAARFRVGAPLFRTDTIVEPQPAGLDEDEHGDASVETESGVSDVTDSVHAGVVRGFELAGARGRCHVNATYVLAGRIMELAGFTKRRVRPTEDIDQARIEAVRRALRRAHAFLPADALITITTP
jgi:hypothetical protein